LCDLSSRATAYRRIEQFDFARGSQPSRKIDIFHQGDRREATDIYKMFTSYENALVAIKRAESPRVPALERFQKTEARMAFVELPIKRATDEIGFIELSQCVDVFLPKFSVGVLKEQPWCGGNACAQV
jgi:hypothetical protein